MLCKPQATVPFPTQSQSGSLEIPISASLTLVTPESATAGAPSAALNRSAAIAGPGSRLIDPNGILLIQTNANQHQGTGFNEAFHPRGHPTEGDALGLNEETTERQKAAETFVAPESDDGTVAARDEATETADATKEKNLNNLGKCIRT